EYRPLDRLACRVRRASASGARNVGVDESMNVTGIGVDIVETARIRDSLEKFGDRFLNRCFLPDEIAYCRSMKFPELHFAARFAAKEAISKAFGTGIGKQLGWRDM